MTEQDRQVAELRSLIRSYDRCRDSLLDELVVDWKHFKASVVFRMYEPTSAGKNLTLTFNCKELRRLYWDSQWTGTVAREAVQVCRKRNMIYLYVAPSDEEDDTDNYIPDGDDNMPHVQNVDVGFYVGALSITASCRENDANSAAETPA